MSVRKKIVLVELVEPTIRSDYKRSIYIDRKAENETRRLRYG